MKIYALCAIGSGVELVRLLSKEIKIAGVIGLSSREGTDLISGYTDLAQACEANGWEYHPVNSYNLSDENDREEIRKLHIDLLIVAGWQRLVPNWLIEHTSYGCIGIHGSADGVTLGRGRSPQNWALIAGADSFELAIFFIDPGVDTGPIIDTCRFPLTSDDDIVSSYLKVNLCAADMIVKACANGELLSRVAQPQPHEGEYLPQRLPDDGQIDWSRSAEDIARFIRALTRPYPGAFSYCPNGGKVTFWRARSLGIGGRPTVPGRVRHRTSEGYLIVETSTDLLLVEEHSDIEGAVISHTQLSSANFQDQIKNIAQRHSSKFPRQKLSKTFLKLMRSQ